MRNDNEEKEKSIEGRWIENDKGSRIKILHFWGVVKFNLDMARAEFRIPFILFRWNNVEVTVSERKRELNECDVCA